MTNPYTLIILFTLMLALTPILINLWGYALAMSTPHGRMIRRRHKLAQCRLMEAEARKQASYTVLKQRFPYTYSDI